MEEAEACYPMVVEEVAGVKEACPMVVVEVAGEESYYPCVKEGSSSSPRVGMAGVQRPANDH